MLRALPRGRRKPCSAAERPWGGAVGPSQGPGSGPGCFRVFLPQGSAGSERPGSGAPGAPRTPAPLARSPTRAAVPCARKGFPRVNRPREGRERPVQTQPPTGHTPPASSPDHLRSAPTTRSDTRGPRGQENARQPWKGRPRDTHSAPHRVSATLREEQFPALCRPAEPMLVPALVASFARVSVFCTHSAGPRC